jgi:hypothetical protein
MEIFEAKMSGMFVMRIQNKTGCWERPGKSAALSAIKKQTEITFAIRNEKDWRF